MPATPTYAQPRPRPPEGRARTSVCSLEPGTRRPTHCQVANRPRRVFQGGSSPALATRPRGTPGVIGEQTKDTVLGQLLIPVGCYTWKERQPVSRSRVCVLAPPGSMQGRSIFCEDLLNLEEIKSNCSPKIGRKLLFV